MSAPESSGFVLLWSLFLLNFAWGYFFVNGAHTLEMGPEIPRWEQAVLKHFGYPMYWFLLIGKIEYGGPWR